MTLSAKFALTLLSLIEDQWIEIAPLPLFLATSTGGIKETEEIYTKLRHQNKKYNLYDKHYFYFMLPFYSSTKSHSMKPAGTRNEKGQITSAICSRKR